MRYISLKHKLPPHFYSTDHLDIRMRTDMALDWATTTLFPHILPGRPSLLPTSGPFTEPSPSVD